MKFKNTWINIRLALSRVAFDLGLVTLCVWLFPKLTGGVDSVGGVSTDTTNTAASEFAYAYKQFYRPGINRALRDHTWLLNRLMANGAPFEMQGSAVIMSVQTGRNQGIGFVNGRGQLPIPGNTTGIRPQSTNSALWGAMGVDHNTLNLTRTDAGAFGNAQTVEIESLEKDMKFAIHQALWNDKTGIIGEINGAPTGAGVITLDNAGLRNSVSGNITLYFIPGMYVDAIDPTTFATVQAGMKVESISGNTITVSIGGVAGAGATADNNLLVRGRQSASGNDYNQGVSGIAAALGSTTNTYWSINRSTAANSAWKPQRVNASGAISLELVRKLVNTCRKYGADKGGKIDPMKTENSALVTSVEAYDAYGKLLEANRRFVGEMQLYGGWSALLAEGTVLVWDQECPVGFVEFLNLDDWNLGSPTGMIAPQIFDADGMVLRMLPGYPMLVAYLVSDFELGCFMPNRSGELYGITGLTPY